MVAPWRGWQVDVTALRGDSIEADLAARDFTVGAVAVPLSRRARRSIPTGGLVDLERGVLRAVGPGSFEEDPLRLLRAARLASRPEPADRRRHRRPRPRRAPRAPPSPPASASWPSCASCSAAPTRCGGLALLDELRITAVVLPELEETKGVDQGPNHHLDVYGHTLEVLEHTLEIEANLARFVGEERADEAAAFLAEPLADEMDRATALRFGALLHDIAKPATRAEERRLRRLQRPRRRRGGRRSARSWGACAPRAS